MMQADQISNLPEGLCRQFSIDEILAATKNFSESLVLGQGGFATVYKGEIDNGGQTVAVKKSKSMSPELRKEFRDEILMVSKFRHSHLLSLIGCCETDDEMILVYEYMASGTLDENLHKRGGAGSNCVIPLSWTERLKIGIGVARGLDYLHTGTSINNKVIHRDIKSSNVLLDQNRTTAKIADFGLSKIGPANQEDTCVMTRVMGTFGYLDPDYYKTSFLTSKSDVYAFGVVLFELLCGRRAVDVTLDHDKRNLADWARLCVKKRKVEQILDPSLKSEMVPRSLSVFVKIANRCLNERPKERPLMTEVLVELLNALSLQETAKESGSNIAEKLMLFFSVKSQPIPDSPSNAIDAALIERDELSEITNDFGKESFICRGTRARLYHGILKGHASCIKVLDFHKLPEEDFIAQVTVKLMLKHKNVVELIGYCADEGLRVLAYESAPNGSLYDILHGKNGAENAQPGPVLSWSQRVKIAFGAAKGLEYLIKNANASLFSYGITSNNVLLFENCDVAKISTTDLWNDAPNDSMHLSAVYEHMASGYCAPEIRQDEEVKDFGLVPLEELVHLPKFESLYEASGISCIKSDIYSFGVVLLELMTGRKPTDQNLPRRQRHLISWAIPKLRIDKVKSCIDPRLNEDYPLESAEKMAALAAKCLTYEAEHRPDIGTVVKALQNLVTEL